MQVHKVLKFLGIRESCFIMKADGQMFIDFIPLTSDIPSVLLTY